MSNQATHILAIPAKRVILDGGEPRFILIGPRWDELDTLVCIHGEKLTWTCDECVEVEKQYPLPN